MRASEPRTAHADYTPDYTQVSAIVRKCLAQHCLCRMMSGFKIHRGKTRGGSSPPSGTFHRFAEHSANSQAPVPIHSIVMHRVCPLIWLLVLGLAGAHLASLAAVGMPCCRGETSRSDNYCMVADVSQDSSAAADAEHSSCCPVPASPSDSDPGSPDDTPHDPDRHPCKCPAQCCVVGKAPLTYTQLPSFDASNGHAPRSASEWREPLPNPTLERLKRPPRPRATA